MVADGAASVIGDVPTLIALEVRQIHRLVIRAAERCDEHQLAWRPLPRALPAGFHVWHIARWADRLQAQIPDASEELRELLGQGREVWEARRLVREWGLDGRQLGAGDTGTGLTDEESEYVRLPGRQPLLSYCEEVLALTNRAVASLSDELLLLECFDRSGRQLRMGAVVLEHLSHTSRHLGMVEALLGAQGLRGTLTE